MKLSTIASGIMRKIRSKLSDIKRLRSIGLNPFQEKALKHNNDNTLKAYQLFGNKLMYVNGFDLLHSLKEIFIEEVYKVQLRPHPLIIDCGANIGLSVIYFKKHFPDARVIAYEPDNTNYELIIQNIKTFGLESVEIRKEAVWNKQEQLYFKTVNSLGSTIIFESDSESYTVQGIRLKDRIKEEVDMLKMDIEGAEYTVLKDIEDKLTLVNNMFIEYHSKFEDEEKLIELLSIIRKAGFKFYIKEAMNIYTTPFSRTSTEHPYEIQLNIFCFRN